MGKCKDITGQRFGKLVAIKRTKIKNHNAYWLCECDCGNYKEVKIKCLLQKSTQSCGCLKKKPNAFKYKAEYITSAISETSVVFKVFCCGIFCCILNCG